MSLIYISPSCERVTGYAPYEFMENPSLLLDIVHPEDHQTVKEHLCYMEKNEDPLQIQFRTIHRDGTIHWIGHVCQSVFSPDGKNLGRRISNRDITRQKIAEEEIKTGIEQIQKNLEIFASIGDEIRNPLTVISILCEELEETIHTRVYEKILEIDNIIRKLDYGFFESEKVHKLLTEHYGI